MVNMNVPYSRPNRSLLTLRDEIYRAYGYTPARASEFVTGYKSPSNFTGHNADANGVVHAMDVFTDENGNLPEAQGRALAEKLRLTGKATGRFSYLIHDMSPGAPDPRIAGAFNGWEWAPYTGESPHSDHIHISTCDLYWGDPVAFPADVYDSTASWGIAGINPSGGGVRPIEPKDDELSASEVATLMAAIKAIPGEVWSFSGKRPSEKNNQTMWNREVVDNENGARTAAQLAALTEVVKQLAVKQGLDITKIDAAVQEAVKKALADNTVNVDVTVGGAK